MANLNLSVMALLTICWTSPWAQRVTAGKGTRSIGSAVVDTDVITGFSCGYRKGSRVSNNRSLTSFQAVPQHRIAVRVPQ